MENKKEKTTPNVSVGADTEQPIQKIAENSISEYEKNIKSFEEMQREMQLSLDPSYLKAVSMNELFDTQYQSKPPLIDGLLYPGTYIFAGSPKLGKSFLMTQLAYLKKLNWPTLFCNTLEVAPDGAITGFRMRCPQSKLTTVKALQSIGYDTIAAGDSYNDLGMIQASRAGFLFKSTAQIKADHPEVPAYEGFDELLAAIRRAMD